MKHALHASVLSSLRKVSFSSRSALSAVMALLLVSIFLSHGAAAQDRRLRGLERDIDEMQEEIKIIQRTLDLRALDGDQSARDNAFLPDYAATVEMRLSAIEERLQSLTGQIEEAQFRLGRLDTRIERLSEDMDFRMRAIEQAVGLTPAPEEPAPSAENGAPVQEEDRPDAAVSPLVIGETDSPRITDQPDTQIASLPPEANPADVYQEGRNQLFRDNYAQAQRTFETFLDHFPDHELAPNALYWLGESFYVREDFARAADAFLQGYQRYGDSSKGSASLLKLGMSLGALGETEQACATLEEFGEQYPDADAALLRRVEETRANLDCSE